jgi:hypothetical protein
MAPFSSPMTPPCGIKGTPEARILDYEVTLKAPAGKPVVFGDTKEGSMAIRLPLWMTPTHPKAKARSTKARARSSTIRPAQ